MKQDPPRTYYDPIIVRSLSHEHLWLAGVIGLIWVIVMGFFLRMAVGWGRAKINNLIAKRRAARHVRERSGSENREIELDDLDGRTLRGSREERERD